MKKILFLGCFLILAILLVGNVRKFNYSSINELVRGEDKFYFLQEGVYEKKENVLKNIKNLEQKVVVYENQKYYVYVGITKDKNISERLKKVYEEKGLKLYEKVQTINNEEFNNNVTQFDLLINNSDTIDEILTIEEVVLANYDELVNNH